MQNPSSSITALSPAKLNLFLHVHQLREDGYHELKTYFQLIDLCDEIAFSTNHSGSISVINPSIKITEEADLCYRAADLLRQYANGSTLGASINVTKNIPDGAGLGGGSSNAATVLLVLNKLWKLHLSESELLKLGLTLGSDVPIFIHGKSTYAAGRGENFLTQENTKSLQNQPIVLLKPDTHVSTQKIFQSQLLTKRPDSRKIPHLDTARYQNDFESVVFSMYPEIQRAAKQLSAYQSAHLTGTGSCLYTVLDDVKKADRIVHALCGEYDVRKVFGIDKSPLYEFK